MALYSALLPVMEANQWFKNGDHPEDRTIHGLNTGRIVGRVSDSLANVEVVCNLCDKPFINHGSINDKVYQGASDDNMVCPGDYIITNRREDGRVSGYSVYRQQLFEFFYGKYKEPIE